MRSASPDRMAGMAADRLARRSVAAGQAAAEGVAAASAAAPVGGPGVAGVGGGMGGGQDNGPDDGLPKIAAATGGGYFELTRTADLADTFKRVADELHRQYALGFAPLKLDGKMHSLELRIAGPGLTARARKSYLA